VSLVGAVGLAKCVSAVRYNVRLNEGASFVGAVRRNEGEGIVGAVNLKSRTNIRLFLKRTIICYKTAAAKPNQ
jgi:hypothetical protein